MKLKIAYLLDSGSSYKIENNPDCFFVPMIIDVQSGQDKTSYRDQIDITNNELSQILKNKVEVKTSQPIIGEIINKATELLNKYDKVIAIPFSSHLSSTYDTFLSVQNNLGSDKFLVANANALSITGNWLVDDLKKYLETNDDISQETLNEICDNIRNNQCGALIIRDASYLISGGRITGLKGLIVRTLKLKLIIRYQGGLEFSDKSNNFLGAIDKALQIIDKKIQFKKYGIKRYTIMPSLDDSNENKNNIEYIMSIIGNKDKYVPSELPGCIQCHTGPNNFSILIESNREF